MIELKVGKRYRYYLEDKDKKKTYHTVQILASPSHTLQAVKCNFIVPGNDEIIPCMVSFEELKTAVEL